MSKFKVGDRFTVNEDDLCGAYKAGDQFEVICGEGEGVTFIDRDGDTRYLHHGRIKPVPVAEATGTATDEAQADKPKFKVGDRVRVHDHPYYLEEDERTGIITSQSSHARGDWDVELDNYDGNDLSFFESELTNISTSLTIRPGKYYITRDGRKVGPMRRWSDEARHRWEADDDELPYIWADDGTEIDSDIDDGADLVAEVDEPGRDNGSTGYGSTAGFTVPLCAYEDEPGWHVTELGRAYADGYAAGLRAAA